MTITINLKTGVNMAIETLKYIKDIIKDEEIINDYDKETIINILSKYDIMNDTEINKILKKV